MSRVATNRIPPDPMTYFWVAAPAVDPPTSVKMMAMGMTVNGRKKVVRRLSSRSGYSISSVAGYCTATLRIVAPPVGVDASRLDSGRLEPAAILEDNDAVGDEGSSRCYARSLASANAAAVAPPRLGQPRPP